LILALLISAQVFASGKKPVNTAPVAEPFQGKKLIEIISPNSVEITLPDNTKKDFGASFYEDLVGSVVNSGRYTHQSPVGSDTQALSAGGPEGVDDYIWSGPTLPIAKISFDVKAMSFVTGSRGNRMFYGFDEHQDQKFQNEFPMKAFDQPTPYFPGSFDHEGDTDLGTLSGLDLGEGFSIDVLFAFLKVKWATYRARLKLVMHFELPSSGTTFDKEVEVKGQGYFYDVVAGYFKFEAGLTLARKDAMLKVFSNIVPGSLYAIDSVVKSMPMLGIIQQVVHDAQGAHVELNTGTNAQVQPGVLYQTFDKKFILGVERSVKSGAICRLIQGELTQLPLGATVVEFKPGELHEGVASISQGVLASSSQPLTMQVADQNIEKTKFNQAELDNEPGLGFFKKLEALLTLPYRIYRYYEYDKKLTDPVDVYSGQSLVAVVDSGIDYMNDDIHDHIWINPSPQSGDLYGWDFVSGDQRPYDDHFHGTEMASAALSKMDDGRVMALKVFNPWGVTTSDHLYSAIKYAVDHGAKVILTAWATTVNSKALQEGIQYAQDHDVVVVASAGDQKRNLDAAPMYPAAYKNRFTNLLTVAGKNGNTNISTRLVDLFSRAEDFTVSRPRDLSATFDNLSSDLASALAAGRLAQIRHEQPKLSAQESMHLLLNEAQVDPEVKTACISGRTLN